MFISRVCIDELEHVSLPLCHHVLWDAVNVPGGCVGVLAMARLLVNYRCSSIYQTFPLHFELLFPEHSRYSYI